MKFLSKYDDANAIQFIKDYCAFDNEEKVYTLFAVSRNKLNKNKDFKKRSIQIVLRNSKSIEDKYYDLASRFKSHGDSFYIYLSLNPRSIAKASMAIINKLVKGIYDKDYKSLKNIDGNWTSTLMSKESRFGRGKFMLDIDTKDITVLVRNRDLLSVLLERETPNGYHFVVEPFNPQIIEDQLLFGSVEIKKDDFIFVNSFMIEE